MQTYQCDGYIAISFTLSYIHHLPLGPDLHSDASTVVVAARRLRYVSGPLLDYDPLWAILPSDCGLLTAPLLDYWAPLRML